MGKRAGRVENRPYTVFLLTILIILLASAAGCQQQPAVPTEVAVEQAPAEPPATEAPATESPAPTGTSQPTYTPLPTYTPPPTDTAVPATDTPAASATPEPASYYDSIEITFDTSGLNDPRLDKEVVGAEFAVLPGTPFRNPETGEATGSGRRAFEMATAMVLGYLYGIDEPHLMPYEELKTRVDEVAETVPAEQLV